MPLSPNELTTGIATWNFQMVGWLKAGITVEEALRDAGRVAWNRCPTIPLTCIGSIFIR
jgi:hypothetical protein